jgi:hypothetical protein
MNAALHPAFSPDLAPSELYLLAKIKKALMGAEFKNEQEFWVVCWTSSAPSLAASRMVKIFSNTIHFLKSESPFRLAKIPNDERVAVRNWHQSKPIANTGVAPAKSGRPNI